MWRRIRCSQCRSTFTSGSAFLAHTHTAGNGAVAEPEHERGANAAACTAATIRAGSALTIKRTPGRRDLHRVRVRSRRRTADQLRSSDKLT